MNTLVQIAHDPAGRLGIILGLVGGCAAIVLSKVGKAVLFPPLSRSRARITGYRTVRHITYPRRPTTYMGLASGC